MSYYYDPECNPITLETWIKTYATKADWEKIARVDETTVGDYWVSTVYLGLDHQFGDGPPLIYETMIFRREGTNINYTELFTQRYTTREQAIEGHKDAINVAQEWMGNPESRKEYE